MPDPIFLTREQAIERLGVPESTFEWMVAQRMLTTVRKFLYHRQDVDNASLALLDHYKSKPKKNESVTLQVKTGNVGLQGNRPRHRTTPELLREIQGGG